MSRNIHILGENRSNTIIKLTDNSAGFERGSQKPLVSFNINTATRDKEVSNVCQMCMLEDITLDMGKNDGGVGVRYHSSNCGRITNITIKAQNGYAGIFIVFGSEATFSDILITGFDYGMDIAYSQIIVLDNIDVNESKIAGIITNDSAVTAKNIKCRDVAGFMFRPGIRGRYYFIDKNISHTDTYGNFVYYENGGFLRDASIPKNPHIYDEFILVNSFGAVADGKTDSTLAIQKAFDSGKSSIIFNEGRYLINGTIKIPASVKYIDFNFCELVSGARLIGGETDCAFEINETNNEILFIENLYTQEHFYGHIRLIKQSCCRDVVLSDIETMMASLYFNTVGGSRIYLDNVFSTTGTYVKNQIIERKGLSPVCSPIIPLEFHGQTVIGRQVNIERAELAMLNDASLVLIDGYRTEGMGSAARTINGGKTVINIFNAGLGCKTDTEFALFEARDNSSVNLTGVYAYGFDEETEYNQIIRKKTNSVEEVLLWDDFSEHPTNHSLIVHNYS